jgi:hydroxymethylbilane synthase
VIRLGTRGSRLARVQSGWVADVLAAAGESVDTVVIRSEGDDTRVPLDSFARPGAFVAALRDALLENRVDVVVHSYKDLPSAPTEGLTVAAVPVRAGVRDVLVTQGGLSLTQLRAGAAVGTSSPRRSEALLRVRPDLQLVAIRGNVDTRLKAVSEGGLDAVVLAEAGLQRLGLLTSDMCLLDPDLMLPAPAQGALAIECRSEDPLIALLARLNDRPTQFCVAAERAVLDEVGAACTTAVGALASIDSGWMTLTADLTAHRGVDYARHADRIEVGDSRCDLADLLGRRVARVLLVEGL